MANYRRRALVASTYNAFEVMTRTHGALFLCLLLHFWNLFWIWFCVWRREWKVMIRVSFLDFCFGNHFLLPSRLRLYNFLWSIWSCISLSQALLISLIVLLSLGLDLSHFRLHLHSLIFHPRRRFSLHLNRAGLHLGSFLPLLSLSRFTLDWWSPSWPNPSHRPRPFSIRISNIFCLRFFALSFILARFSVQRVEEMEGRRPFVVIANRSINDESRLNVTIAPADNDTCHLPVYKSVEHVLSSGDVTRRTKQGDV